VKLVRLRSRERSEAEVLCHFANRPYKASRIRLPAKETLLVGLPGYSRSCARIPAPGHIVIPRIEDNLIVRL